jgi:hypothetical protein
VLHRRSLVALAVPVLALAAVLGPTWSARSAAATDVTACHDAELPRQLTEVDAEISVPQFDPALGELLEVSVPTQTLHLDTDARFENTASSPALLNEHMTFDVSFTGPPAFGPVELSGSIQRVPAQTLPAFDGTLDFSGPSSFVQATTARDQHAGSQQHTDSTVRSSFTGLDTIIFRIVSAIGEHFTSGGGNVAFDINTYVAAAVRVCYRYQPTSPPTPPEQPVPVPGPVDVRFTG